MLPIAAGEALPYACMAPAVPQVLLMQNIYHSHNGSEFTFRCCTQCS
jgi:hypothetical protein